MATYDKDDCHKCIGGHLDKILMSNERKSEALCKKLVEDLVAEELRPLIDAESSEDEISLKIAEVERLYKARHEVRTYGMSTKQIWQENSDNFRCRVDVQGQKKENVLKEEEELKEKEKAREEMRNTQIQEDETMLKSRQEDIIKQEKQIEDDYNESSEAILAQVAQLVRTHSVLARELQEVKAKLEEETKKMKEELNRKRKQIR
ncbi:golgin subfamily A member 6-like protein 7 [Ptychodera flava]|uniref:golgin subfamily A member 6-like protein 7 n=1 Tax=Ptychodera flava TaxID=63121 RepID=UPI00396A335A